MTIDFAHDVTCGTFKECKICSILLGKYAATNSVITVNRNKTTIIKFSLSLVIHTIDANAYTIKKAVISHNLFLMFLNIFILSPDSNILHFE